MAMTTRSPLMRILHPVRKVAEELPQDTLFSMRQLAYAKMSWPFGVLAGSDLCSLPAARYGKNRHIPLRRVSSLTKCSTASALSQDELEKHHRSYLASVWSSQMATPYTPPSIDEYLRKRLMPVEGAIPVLRHNSGRPQNEQLTTRLPIVDL